MIAFDKEELQREGDNILSDFEAISSVFTGQVYQRLSSIHSTLPVDRYSAAGAIRSSPLYPTSRSFVSTKKPDEHMTTIRLLSFHPSQPSATVADKREFLFAS